MPKIDSPGRCVCVRANATNRSCSLGVRSEKMRELRKAASLFIGLIGTSFKCCFDANLAEASFVGWVETLGQLTTGRHKARCKSVLASKGDDTVTRVTGVNGCAMIFHLKGVIQKQLYLLVTMKSLPGGKIGFQ